MTLSAQDIVERLQKRLPTRAIGKGRHGDTIVDYDYDAIETERTEAADSISRLTADNEALRKTNEHWRRQSQDSFEAFSAMRDAINEVVPMQSAEANLLAGPELFVSCEAVVLAVVSRVTALEAAIAAYRQSSIRPDNYDHLRKALEAIRDFPKPGTSRRTEDGYPEEIIYDEFAYRRIVDSYREFARSALGDSNHG